MTIAERIKLRREELNMTQEELAHKIGTNDRSGISRIEKSGDDVTMKNVIRIATALSTTPRYLMGFEEAPVEDLQYTTLNQIYHILKRDKEFDDRAIPVVFGYDSEEDMLNQIKNHGPIIIPYSRVKEVANIYNLSPDYLMGFTNERRVVIDSKPIELQNVATVRNPNIEAELSLIQAYRKASEEKKDIIFKILDIPTDNVLSENRKLIFHSAPKTKKVVVKERKKQA